MTKRSADLGAIPVPENHPGAGVVAGHSQYNLACYEYHDVANRIKLTRKGASHEE